MLFIRDEVAVAQPVLEFLGCATDLAGTETKLAIRLVDPPPVKMVGGRRLRCSGGLRHGGDHPFRMLTPH